MAKSRDAAKEQYWRGMIQQFEASGLGVRGFCDREGLSERRFYWWRRTLRQRDRWQARHAQGNGKRGRVHRGSNQRGEPSVLPVGLPFSVGGPIVVVHPRGHVLRVSAVFDPTACVLPAAVQNLCVAVPEPSTFVLFAGLGASGLVMAWRRRKRGA